MSAVRGAENTTPLVTQAALAELYGCEFAVISELKYAKKVKQLLDGFAKVFVIHADGNIITYTEFEKAELSPVKGMHGFPTGLKLFVSSDRHQGHIKSISDYCDRQDLLERPIHVDKLGFFAHKLERKLLEVLLQFQIDNRDTCSKAIQSLALLRLEHERTLRKLDKAERITDGLGYLGYSLVYGVPVGAKKIGPGGDIDVSSLSQHLPTDLACLAAFEVFIENVPAQSEGTLEIIIRRSADGLIVSTHSIATKELVQGWNLFEVEYVSDDLVGEAALDIRWLDDKATSVLFALSDTKADRFGLKSETPSDTVINDTMALRIWQGNTLCKKEKSVASENAENIGAVETVLPAVELTNGVISRNTMQVYNFPEVTPRISFLHGEEAHKKIFYNLDYWPLMISEDDGYMQTHPLNDTLSGAIMFAGAPEGTKSVRARIRTAHAGAPELLYILARIPSDLSSSPKTIERALALVKELDQMGQASGVDEATGIIWSSLCLPADTASILKLDIGSKVDSPTSGSGDLLFATMPLHDGIAWAWCRWYSLYVETDLSPQAIHPASAKMVEA